MTIWQQITTHTKSCLYTFSHLEVRLNPRNEAYSRANIVNTFTNLDTKKKCTLNPFLHAYTHCTYL